MKGRVDVGKGAGEQGHHKQPCDIFPAEFVKLILLKIKSHQIDLSQTELFQRLKETGVIKYNVMKRFPQGFDFLKSLEHKNSEDVK
ncbi:MAG: hypothetical protein P1P82_11180 [Bacteroidales bacterium]|nr:hypothetical protein [Bacteroidales bacterium]MDT8431208.1 hypothetical protein [Bacteroidales bacterium]